MRPSIITSSVKPNITPIPLTIESRGTTMETPMRSHTNSSPSDTIKREIIQITRSTNSRIRMVQTNAPHPVHSGHHTCPKHRLHDQCPQNKVLPPASQLKEMKTSHSVRQISRPREQVVHQTSAQPDLGRPRTGGLVPGRRRVRAGRSWWDFVCCRKRVRRKLRGIITRYARHFRSPPASPPRRSPPQDPPLPRLPPELLRPARFPRARPPLAPPQQQ